MHHPILHVVKQAQKHDTNTLHRWYKILLVQCNGIIIPKSVLGFKM